MVGTRLWYSITEFSPGQQVRRAMVIQLQVAEVQRLWWVFNDSHDSLNLQVIINVGFYLVIFSFIFLDTLSPKPLMGFRRIPPAICKPLDCEPPLASLRIAN